MPDSFIPRLRGNTFFLLLLRAARSELGNAPSWRSSAEGLTQTQMFAGLMRICNPSYAITNEGSLMQNISRYMKGTLTNSPTYYPFKSPNFRNGAALRLESDYKGALDEMDTLCRNYLDCTNDGAMKLLAGGLCEMILLDTSVPPEAAFNTGSKVVAKEALAGETAFVLQPFLLSVWSYIVLNQPEAKEGAETYMRFTADAGSRNQRRITTEIGAETAKKIAVSVSLLKGEPTDAADKVSDGKADPEAVQRQTPENLSGRTDSQSAEKTGRSDHSDNACAPAGVKMIQPLDGTISAGVESYLKKLAKKYDCIPTILFREPLSPLREYYVPNYVEWQELVPGRQGVSHTRSAKDGNILGISRHIVLSGTGGLGKSMMMRHLLLTSVDGYRSSGRIPFFIPLKDYSDAFPSMLDYVFSVSANFWPELTREKLSSILESGSALLLFDGFDEIHSSLLAGFTRKMNDFQDRYSENSFIISSRPYSNFRSISRSTVIDLKPLTFEQALELVKAELAKSDL